MKNKTSRMLLLAPVVTIFLFIIGTFAIGLTNSDFIKNSTNSVDIEQEKVPNGFILLGIRTVDGSCCGHIDITPPIVTLTYLQNNTILYPGGEVITLIISDDNPNNDFLAEQVLYHWDNATSNTTLSAPYDVTLPTENGTHILYVYTLDAADNWGSFIYVLTVGLPPPAILLVFPTNNSVLLSGSTLDFTITDEYSGVSQVLFHWDDAASNTTLSDPYDVILPVERGFHNLYLYAQNGEGNWSSVVFQFYTTTDSSSVSIAETTDPNQTTTPRRRTPGFLFLYSILSLGLTILLITKKRRK
ncbi:MAG: hypothetical protein ACXABI_01935 [Candidatus Hodarchaeales archaeon]